MSHAYPHAHAAVNALNQDRTPNQKPQPWAMRPDLVVKMNLNPIPSFGLPRRGITSRPIMLNVSAGYYVHLMRVTRSGLLQRHRHLVQVHAYVIKGEWHYLGT
jgi:hypothetical protein